MDDWASSLMVPKSHEMRTPSFDEGLIFLFYNLEISWSFHYFYQDEEELQDFDT